MLQSRDAIVLGTCRHALCLWFFARGACAEATKGFWLGLAFHSAACVAALLIRGCIVLRWQRGWRRASPSLFLPACSLSPAPACAGPEGKDALTPPRSHWRTAMP
jgi:hypothetical protein